MTDIRQLKFSTLRCDPIAGYYDPEAIVALPYSYPNCCGYTPVIYNDGSACVITCPAGFAENSTTRVCFTCDLGYWAVSRHCTNVIGCVSTFFKSNRVLCVFCRVTDNFILMSQTCICSYGYSLDTRTGSVWKSMGTVFISPKNATTTTWRTVMVAHLLAS